MEGYDPKTNETFYRPIGGGVEFGEYAKDAAIREFEEELNTKVSIGDSVQVFESIFEFDGKPGHEVVFIYEAKFEDAAFYESQDFVGNEDGAEFKALWVDIEEFTSGRKILYPNEFAASLVKSNNVL